MRGMAPSWHLFTLLCAAPAFADPALTAHSAAAEVCQAPPTASLNLETRGGALLVPITVQNQSAYMILSMGAALSSVASQAVDRLALPVTHYSDSALLANGEKVKTSVNVSNLAIGGVRVPQQDLMIDPNSDEPGRFASPDIVGTLGIDLLRESDIELDLANGKLLLYSPGQCRGHVVRWTDHAEVVPLRRSPNGSFYFSMTLDGRKLETAFSTTNSATTISTDLSKRVYGFDKTTPGLETITGVDGHTSFARVMQLTTSSLSLSDEKVYLHDPPKDCMLARKPDGIGYDYCFGAYPLLLGLHVLSKLHIYIDTQNNLLYFTRNQ